MDPKANPYAPGAGAQPPEFAGRDGILSDAEIALARVLLGRHERSLILTGLRGVGKTVLLNRIRDLAEKAGYKTDLIEAPEDEPLASLLVPTLRQALMKMSLASKASDLAQRAFRVLKSFALSMNLLDGEISLTYEPEAGVADSGRIDRDLPELLVAIGEAARASKTGVAILIDEIQYLSAKDLGALIVAMHRIVQRNLPVIVIGAGLPSIPALSGNAKSYAERLFRYPVIGALNQEDAERALADPAEALGVKYTHDALHEIYSTTVGYPYFVQEWGYVVWNVARRSPITAHDVTKATTEALRRLDESFFRVRLDRVTDAEQRYLRAMAELGTGPYKSGDVARVLRKNSTAFGTVREGLITKGMIFSPKYGLIDFTVPLFHQYMRRAVPQL